MCQSSEYGDCFLRMYFAIVASQLLCERSADLSVKMAFILVVSHPVRSEIDILSEKY